MPNSIANNLRSILYIEDDKGLARLLQKKMQRLGYDIAIAFSLEEGLNQIRSNNFDLILLDYYLPDGTGIEFMERLGPLSDYPPIIVLTASGDEKVAVSALEKGAADYAIKDAQQYYLDLLPAVMQASFVKDRLAKENLSQKKELAYAKDKAEAANRAKSDFLATMSHEIRTPMNVVVGLASLLEETPLNPKQKEMVSTLRSNANILLKLINDLLDLSKIESGQIKLDQQPFSFSEILENIKSMFALQASQKGLKLEVKDHTDNKNFLGDATRIQQIIMNLLGNAIKFTEKGFIEIEIKTKNYEGDLKQITLKVKDTGIGISEDHINHIFNKFVQADQTITKRFGGSGLGLAISQKLSHLMKGNITVESKEGTGSVFTAFWLLPASDENLEKESNKISPSPVNSENNKILLVEDYLPNVMVATMMLENLGYTVESVNSGYDAIEKIKNNNGYKVILMDVQMGDIDGYETTRKIREIEKDTGIRHKIIGVTAHALAGDRSKCIESGMDDYMSKPIHPNILEKKISDLLAA